MPVTLYNIYRLVIASDTVDLPLGPCDALYIGSGGTVAVTNGDNTVTQFMGTAGSLIPIKVKRVNLTGTGASSVIALYDR